MRKTAAERWVDEHPYGEQGTTEYWIEAMKRAYELGETRALAELDRLLSLEGPVPPMRWMDFPWWFQDLWVDQLAPYNRWSHQMAMPY